MNLLLPRRIEFHVGDSVRETVTRVGRTAAASGVRFESHRIGESREGRELWGMILGRGARAVSIVAGAHADEPVGPVTALEFARWLALGEESRDLVESHTFRICPQINPDGAEANSRWFRDPLDPVIYFENVRRESPGDDIEFGYPRDAREAAEADAAVRPENVAVARFLAAGGPFCFHATLHGMGFAEGAWFLINREWAERSAPLRERLTRVADELGLGFHDIDRRGEKGFTRIARGYCTTPASDAMRSFFLERADPVTAGLFRPSSMEFVRSLGGDPLLMVSELPLFRIHALYDWPSDPAQPPGEDTPFQVFRMRLQAALFESEGEERTEALRRLIEEMDLRPVDPRTQVTMQARMIIEALEFVRAAGG